MSCGDRGGGVDHVLPPAVNRATAKLQHKTGALTAYKEFPGRSHYTIGQEGWEEVADYALSWATENALTRPTNELPAA